MFNNYLLYNSMNVNTIGTLNDYIIPNEKTFIQASIIRLEDNSLSGTYYSANELFEISNELKKGVYI